MGVSVNIGGVWENMDKGYVNIGGVWKEIDKIFCNIDGVWKEGYSSDNTTMWIHRSGDFYNKLWSLIDLDTGAIISDINPSGYDILSNMGYQSLCNAVVSPIDGSIYYVGMAAGGYPNISKISKDGTHTVIVQSAWDSSTNPVVAFGQLVIDFTNGYIYSVGNRINKYDMSGNFILSYTIVTRSISTVSPPILNYDKSKIRTKGNYSDGESTDAYMGVYNTYDLSYIPNSYIANIPTNNQGRRYTVSGESIFNAQSNVLMQQDFVTGAQISVVAMTISLNPGLTEIDDMYVYTNYSTGFRRYLQSNLSNSTAVTLPTSHGSVALLNITARNGFIYASYSANSNATWWLAKYNRDTLALIYDVQIPKTGGVTQLKGHVMTYINK